MLCTTITHDTFNYHCAHSAANCIKRISASLCTVCHWDGMQLMILQQPPCFASAHFHTLAPIWCRSPLSGGLGHTIGTLPGLGLGALSLYCRRLSRRAFLIRFAGLLLSVHASLSSASCCAAKKQATAAAVELAKGENGRTN